MIDALRIAWRAWRRFLVGRGANRATREAVGFFTALGLTLGAAILAFGALPLPALIVVAIAAAATAAAALRRPDARIEGPAIVFFCLGIWSLLQACPLPLGVVRTLSPKAASIWLRAYSLTGMSLRWTSLSLDPGASIVEALKWTSYGAVAITAALVTRRLELRVIAALAFGLGLTLALVTAVHGLLRAHTVYGFYVPSFDPGPWGVGPILNDNNRSGYLNLGAFAGMSLLVSRDPRKSKWPIALGSGVLVAMSLMARSRAGIGALAIGAATLSFILFRRAKTREGQRRRFYLRAAVPLMLAIGGGMALAIIGGDLESWQRLRDESLEKLHLVGWTWPMASDFFLFGTGRGAFESVFSAYQQTGSRMVYNHAENFIADWTLEWGALVAIPALIALARMLRPRRQEELPLVILRLGLVVLLGQNLMDHALETPAIALLTATVVAGLVASAPREASAVPKRLGPALVALVAALSGATLLFSRKTVEKERARLSGEAHELGGASADDRSAFLAEVSGAVRRHPADAFLPLLGAFAALDVPGTHPLEWIGWALERDMKSGNAHLALAYLLRAAGSVEESLRQLKVAAQDDPNLRARAADWAVHFARTAEDVRLAIPEGPDGAATLLALAASPRMAPLRFELLEEATRRDPDLIPAQTAAAFAYIRALEDPSDSACHGLSEPECVDRAKAHLRVLSRLEPEKPHAVELTARLLAATGRGNEARALLSSQCGTFAAPANCWRLRISLAGGEVSGPALQQAITTYYTAACTNPDPCVQAATWLGGTLEARADYAGALAYYGRAVRLENSASTWVDIARAARLAGQPRRATEALKRAMESPGLTAAGQTELEYEDQQRDEGTAEAP